MKRRIGVATRETFQSLGVRNFRLFFTGQFISQVGNWLTMIALTPGAASPSGSSSPASSGRSCSSGRGPG
jgi:hypothetical protein